MFDHNGAPMVFMVNTVRLLGKSTIVIRKNWAYVSLGGDKSAFQKKKAGVLFELFGGNQPKVSGKVRVTGGV